MFNVVNADIDTLLEDQLLRIGAVEREIIDLIPILTASMRAAFQAGDDALGEYYAHRITAYKAKLKEIEPIIQNVEQRLYGRRNRKRT